jgi:hypothetical protein
MLTPEQFRDRIEAFLTASGMTATRFGIDAVRDPNFVHDVRKGRVPSLAVAGQVLRFIDERNSAPGSDGEVAA